MSDKWLEESNSNGITGTSYPNLLHSKLQWENEKLKILKSEHRRRSKAEDRPRESYYEKMRISSEQMLYVNDTLSVGRILLKLEEDKDNDSMNDIFTSNEGGSDRVRATNESAEKCVQRQRQKVVKTNDHRFCHWNPNVYDENCARARLHAELSITSMAASSSSSLDKTEKIYSRFMKDSEDTLKATEGYLEHLRCKQKYEGKDLSASANGDERLEVGHAILRKMGWDEKHAFGREDNLQPRNKPLRVFKRPKTLGLGHK